MLLPGMTKRTFDAMNDVEILIAGNEAVMASSHVLAAASRVFEAMLASGMKESQTKKIKLAEKTKEEVELFLQLIHPVSGRHVRVTNDNVGHLLPLLVEYQVEGLEEECEAALMSGACSCDRLLMAKKFGMARAATKIITDLALKFPDVDISRLSGSPDVANEFLIELKKHVIPKNELSVMMGKLADVVGASLPVNAKIANAKDVRPGITIRFGTRADEEIPRAIRSVGLALEDRRPSLCSHGPEP